MPLPVFCKNRLKKNRTVNFVDIYVQPMKIHTSLVQLPRGYTGEWCVKTLKQFKIKCMAPTSMTMRRKSMPSSVVNGELSSNWRKTSNGNVGNEGASDRLYMSSKLK